MLIIYWSNENRLWESVFSYALSKGKETFLMNLIWFQPQKHICTVIIFLAKYMCLPKVIYWSIRYEYSGSCDKHLILNDRISILIDISFSFFLSLFKVNPPPPPQGSALNKMRQSGFTTYSTETQILVNEKFTSERLSSELFLSFFLIRLDLSPWLEDLLI